MDLVNLTVSISGKFPLIPYIKRKRWKMKEFEIKQKDETYDLLVHVADLIESGGCRVKVTSLSKKRSLLQNKSIFKYYRVIAEKLNDAGLTSRSFFEKLREG